MRPDGATIRSGPRWDAVLAAVDAAATALAAPLDDEERAAGWTEALQDTILEDVERVRGELHAGPTTRVVLGDWSGVDDVGEDGAALRVDTILDVDLVLGDLDRAEQALAASRRLLEDLASPVSAADRATGFDDAVRDELAELVGVLAARLESGAYLTHAELDPWADALRALDFVRRSPAPGLYDDATLEGFTRQPISEWPRGARFEAIALYDQALGNVAVSDALDEALEARGVGGDDEETTGAPPAGDLA